MHHRYVYPNVIPVERQRAAPPLPAPYRMTRALSQRELVEASLRRCAATSSR